MQPPDASGTVRSEGTRMANRPKMPVSERAKQFAPFAAVTGLDILLREKERENMREQRRILSDERAAEIDASLRQLSEGDSVTVSYYDGYGYTDISGTADNIDIKDRSLSIDGTAVSFDDIYDIR